MNNIAMKTDFFTWLIDQHSDAPELESSKSFPIERHEEREVLLVLAGNSEFTLNGKRFRTVPGTAFFIDRWIPHPLSYSQANAPCRHYKILRLQ